MALFCTLASGCTSAAVGETPPRIEATATTAALQTAPAAPIAASGDVAVGKRLLAEGDYRGAVDHLTRAIERAHLRDPLVAATRYEADIYYQRGLAFLKLGFPDNAAADFTEAINLKPGDGAYYEYRGRAYVELGDAYKSLRDCTQAIRLQHDNGGAFRTRGIVYARRGEFERAVADLEQASRTSPSLAEGVKPLLADAYFRWQEELSQSGDAAAASEKLAAAQALDPALVAKASAACSAATPAVEQTVAKPVLDAAVERFEAGRTHQAARRFDQALIAYTEAIARRRDYSEAYLRRGETLLDMGFPDTAIEDLKRAALDDDAAAEAYRLQARAFMDLGSANRASLAATDSLHADPTVAATYALRGQAYAKLERWDRAKADLEEAVRRDPSLTAQMNPTLDEVQRRLAEAHKREAIPHEAPAAP
jgi:tetratricopeptide (TPR) repeat protein